MKIDLYTKIVLTILTVFVGILVFRDVDFVTKAQANESLSTLQIEDASNNNEITFFIYDNTQIQKSFDANYNRYIHNNKCEISDKDIPTQIVTTRKIAKNSYITIEKTY